MKHSCYNCGAKVRCLKRSYLIYLLYIVTGRINDLTSEVRENVCVEGDCENWLASSSAAP